MTGEQHTTARYVEQYSTVYPRAPYDYSVRHISCECTYDLFGPVRNVFLMRADRLFWALKWQRAKSRFPKPNLLPLALVMDLHASKTLRPGPYKP